MFRTFILLSRTSHIFLIIREDVYSQFVHNSWLSMIGLSHMSIIVKYLELSGTSEDWYGSLGSSYDTSVRYGSKVVIVAIEKNKIL